MYKQTNSLLSLFGLIDEIIYIDLIKSNLYDRVVLGRV